jgi:hypothetical protein
MRRFVINIVYDDKVYLWHASNPDIPIDVKCITIDYLIHLAREQAKQMLYHNHLCHAGEEVRLLFVVEHYELIRV